jgi:hypothetical protein
LKINYNATTNKQLKPNYEIHQSFDDFLQGEDSVFDFTKNLIKSASTNDLRRN